jgi:hypothetical protein
MLYRRFSSSLYAIHSQMRIPLFRSFADSISNFSTTKNINQDDMSATRFQKEASAFQAQYPDHIILLQG